MQKHEFEERIESTVSDEDYKLIEFVYQFHPVIRNVSGKDEVAELYKSFGMALFRDMEPRAKKAKEVEEKMTSCRLEIETLTELLATRKAEMKDLEAELQGLVEEVGILHAVAHQIRSGMLGSRVIGLHGRHRAVDRADAALQTLLKVVGTEIMELNLFRHNR